MTSLLSVRKRAEEFAAAVDGRPQGDRAARGETSELVHLVAVLRDRDHVSPRPEFAGLLRDRLMDEASTALSPRTASLVLPVRARGVRERRLVAAASALVLIGGTAGMAAAAQDALPGQALYPVKRGIERAQAGLSLSSAAKGRDLLGQASDRLHEVDGLLDDGGATSVAAIPQTLDDFIAQAQEGSGLLLASFQDDRDPSSVATVREFAANGLEHLQDLSATAPPGAQDELTRAAVAMRDIDQRAASACAACAADLPDLELPDVFLVASEVDRAMANMRSTHVTNNHPVVATKKAVSKAARDARSAADRTGDEPGAGSSGAGAPATVPAPALPTPSKTAPDTGGKVVLPGVDEPLGSPDDVTKLPGQVIDGLADGASGAVETLLPRPEPQDAPPDPLDLLP